MILSLRYHNTYCVCVPKPSSTTKETAQDASPCRKSENKEESDSKAEEKEPADTPPATMEEKKAQEEGKEETKQTAKQAPQVKDETPGNKRQPHDKLLGYQSRRFTDLNSEVGVDFTDQNKRRLDNRI